MTSAGPSEGSPFRIDVTGDGFVSPLDALLILNWLHLNPVLPSGAGGEGEAPRLAPDRTAEALPGPYVPEELLALLAWDRTDLTPRAARRRR